MKSRDFCYWLQGYFELDAAARDEGRQVIISPKQAEIIRNHLNMVFKHEIDPAFGSTEHVKELSKTHEGIVETTIRGEAIRKISDAFEGADALKSAYEIHLNC